MKRILAATLAVLTTASSVTMAFAQPTPVPRFAAEADPLQMVQYRGNRGPGINRDAFRDRSYWDRRQGRGYYDRTYGHYRRDNDSALAAGFLGLVLGAAIVGAASDRERATSRLNDRDWVTSCARRYRSFDPHSGTYLGNDGYRHYCH